MRLYTKLRAKATSLERHPETLEVHQKIHQTLILVALGPTPMFANYQKQKNMVLPLQ